MLGMLDQYVALIGTREETEENSGVYGPLE